VFRLSLLVVLWLTLAAFAASATAQSVPLESAETIKAGLEELQSLPSVGPDTDIFAKSVEWILRHNEFFKPDYAKQTLRAIELGKQRLRDKGERPWFNRVGRSVYGYQSAVDGSVQPYAITIPPGVDPTAGKRWPLHVVLHGRAATMNEVNFIARHEGKPLPQGQDWIQLDVFGRTNNAYRWSGETDVFEAMQDVFRRFRIDENRITLHGFSMGGAGAWHLGMHYPDLWSSVGPGAGFVDFYKYQNQTRQLPIYQHRTLGIYDSIDYALNAFNVPVCTYGGEKDAQLVAGQSMTDAAQKLAVKVKLIIGPNMGHKFDDASRKTFMDFHQKHSASGRKRGRKRNAIRFTTRTLKYNKCDWITIEEITEQYAPTVVEAEIDDNGDLEVTTKNVEVLTIDRGICGVVTIDDDGPFDLESAADGLLPNVYYERKKDGWVVMSYQDSRSFDGNPDTNKRHQLQGPIDDAFTRPFICIRGTSDPRSKAHQAWADWTLNRFQHEYDKWLRAEVPVVDDSVALEMLDDPDSSIHNKNLVLFGDPGSNSVLAKVLDKLPIKWEGTSITVDGKHFDTNTHGLSFIYPNPLNQNRYVVINSGHTMHEKNFMASNSWLFPRLGDIAVQAFTKTENGYDEAIVWAEIFNGGWRFPAE
jgi:dienelactone hydrolase